MLCKSDQTLWELAQLSLRMPVQDAHAKRQTGTAKAFAADHTRILLME